MLRRTFDIVGAILGLVILSPLFLFLVGAIGHKMGRPVLFRQVRSGRGGVPFEMIKFRTMRDAYDPSGAPLSDAERLTPFGQRLRASSLDELPELWNVLRGEMSLVGPRPQLTEFEPYYTPQQARRLEVRPGITGWAQVNGRNALSWEQKFAFDVWYVEHRSIWLDLKILWLTGLIVLRQEGISAPDHTTMPRFRGRGAGPL